MTRQLDRRQVLRLGVGISALALLAACDTTGFGLGERTTPLLGRGQAPRSGGQSFGTGRTRVALLLPLTGDAGLVNVGRSMANAAQLAIDYVTASPRIGDNITLLLLDTGATAAGAAQQASNAIAAGASLILGPLKADQVEAAGGVAKSAGIPLIGFSNNSSAAAPGVYLLSVLPEGEVHRSLGYALAHGHRSIAAILPATPYGEAQRAALQQVSGSLGIKLGSVLSFASAAEAQTAAQQLGSGAADAIFLPDRASAPGLAGLLQPSGKRVIIGSADWDMDPAIVAAPALAGAIYPAVDDTGYKALAPEYAARFGTNPHPLATIAYTAVVLANAEPLVEAHYGAGAMTLPGGFNGRDGVFRFLADGRSQYALVMKQVTAGGAVRIDGPKL